MIHVILRCALFLCFGIISLAYTQDVQSPKAWLGYSPGERFAYHHEVINYVRHIAQASPRVSLFTYGKSYEGRDLVATVISSQNNLTKLEDIRRGHLARIGFDADSLRGPERTIVWLSYNVHGNEAACTEAALSTLYGLASGQGDTAAWLDKLVIILDPCLNPDGRERYVQHYRQRAAPFGNADPNAWEHTEPWPTGRYNHYLFDPNRDWCWQTQRETQQRVKLFRQWMPHIHADFHEMGHQSSYFFAPAAKPFHKVVTPWQRRFQEICGEHHAQYFNKKNWRFFTGEIYDLFYPSYGDTWPMFSGAMGFTYEQAGSGKAGICIHRGGDDTLHLRDRVAHHILTGFSTIEIAFKERQKLISKQIEYFETPLEKPPGSWTSFVVRTAKAPLATRALMRFLDKQMIRYSFAQNGYSPLRIDGFDYRKNLRRSFRIDPGDLIVTTAQPQGRLVKVLMEPEAWLEDSLTYDLTAWALPWAFDVEAFACEQVLSTGQGAFLGIENNPSTQIEPYAWLLPWNDASHAAFLAEALREGVKIRYSTKEAMVDEQVYSAGSLAILAGENDEGVALCLQELAKQHGLHLEALPGGRLSRGSDLGSEHWKLIEAPKVALITGEGTRATATGELWHHFEQTLHYPVSLIEKNKLDRVWLNKYDVILLPDGEYNEQSSSLISYLKEGGKIIALEKAVLSFAEGSDSTMLAEATRAERLKTDGTEAPPTFNADPGRGFLSDRIAGSIYAVSLDPEHVLSYGYGDRCFIIKNNNISIPLLPDGSGTTNVGRLGYNAHISGFSGVYARKKVENSLAIGVEQLGEGKIVYMSSSPIFRGFWRSGELLLANAVFFL
jgi:hypothetical protein